MEEVLDEVLGEAVDRLGSASPLSDKRSAGRQDTYSSHMSLASLQIVLKRVFTTVARSLRYFSSAIASLCSQYIFDNARDSFQSLARLLSICAQSAFTLESLAL